MLLRYCGGIIPGSSPNAADEWLIEEGTSLADRIDPLVHDVRIHLALDHVIRFVQSLNRYADAQRPWDLARDPDKIERLETVLANLVAGLQIASALLEPAMPTKMQELRASLSLGAVTPGTAQSWAAPAETRIPSEYAILFPKRDEGR